MAKTALNSSHALYGNIVAAWGFDEASGNAKELVSSTLNGVLQAGATRGTDGTYGAYIDSDGSTGGIFFGDITAFDGRTACSIAILQISDLSAAGSNRAVANKFTSGTQTFELTWLSSDNLYTRLYTSDSTTTTANLADGIHPTNGAPPQSAHVAGWTYGATAGLTTFARSATTTYSTATALTGTINNSTWEFKVHTQWDGKCFGVVIFNKELSASEIASIGPNLFTDMFAGLEPLLSSATATGISTTGVTLGASTSQTSGTGWVVVDSSANLSGVTVAQIKAGQKASGAAALAAANLTISASPFTTALTSLSLTPNTTYTFKWVQNNANGDSAILSSTFAVPGIAISSLTGTLTPGATATAAVTLAGTTQGTVTLTDSNSTVVNCTVTAWPTSTGDGDVTFTVPGAIANSLKPGTVTATITKNGGGAGNSDTETATLVIDTGYTYGLVVSQDTGADDYLDADPAPVAGDGLAYHSFLRTSAGVVTAYAVTVNLNGLAYTIPGATIDGSYYFDFTFYDEVDNTWDTTPGRKTVIVGDVDPGQQSAGRPLTKSLVGDLTPNLHF